MEHKNTYLLPVLPNQKEWFNKEFGFINNEDFLTDGADWEMLKNNIFGNNERLIDYSGNSIGLLEGFWLGHSSGGTSTINTKYFLDIILVAIKKAIDFEFYELAFNIKIVHKAIIRCIKLEQEGEDRWKQGIVDKHCNYHNIKS
jgi:hypothetical protein